MNAALNELGSQLFGWFGQLSIEPAVWLCGRLLRWGTEQACDDFVVCATGRSKAVPVGLAHIAERAFRSNL